MKYFIDFEATQFTNEIIEIGCIREDGEVFQSYVHSKKKVTDFITNLTGITQEMVDNAPSSDEVFSKFYDWIKGDLNVEFYCYGNADLAFVRKNLEKTKSFKAQAALSIVGMGLCDYANKVKDHFGLMKPIALVKVLAYYRKVESVEQKHSALEDAKYLKELFEYILADRCVEECPFPEYQKQKEILTPHISRLRKGKVIETYNTMEDAVQWIIDHLEPVQKVECSPRNIAKKIRKAANSNTPYHNGFKWRIYGNTAEVKEILDKKKSIVEEILYD